MAPKRSASEELPDRTAEGHQDKRLRTAHVDSHPEDDEPLNPKEQQRPGKKFNLITALCKHADVLLHFVQFLPPKSLLDLHSISAPFHIQFCSNQTTFILAATRQYAPSAVTISPWKHYARLCTYDPAYRLPTYYTPAPGAPLRDTLRRIPSLRWLRQCVYRHFVAESILGHLTMAGTEFPPLTAQSLTKLWFCLDLPLSMTRVSLFRGPYFTDADLFRLMLFFVKLDMHFTDPIAYSGSEVRVRQALLAETSLTPLWNALRRPWTRLDALKLWVRHKYRPQNFEDAWPGNPRMFNMDSRTIMDVPLALCGRAGWELYGLGQRPLIRVETLVLGEQFRRGLELEKRLISMMWYGYVDPSTLENISRERNEELILPEKRWSKELRTIRERETVRMRELQVKELLEGESDDYEQGQGEYRSQAPHVARAGRIIVEIQHDVD